MESASNIVINQTVTGYIGHLSVGAQADSAHEYLLKQYLLTARTDKSSLEMCKGNFISCLSQLIHSPDIRATTQILTNLMYISPSRQLLYVTDTTTSTYNHNGRPSHVFEHLSCFLPGLLALGAHTLPLDDLAAMGISLAGLSNGTFGDAERGYHILEGYNLKEIHMWAAEGLAQTCRLTYADQPTGLGPEEIIMQTSEDTKKWEATADGERENGGGVLWIDSMEKWRDSGKRGPPPGLKEKEPVIYTERERMRGSGRGRDYVVKKGEYILRPEVSLYFFQSVKRSLTGQRPSSLCIYFGASLVIASGAGGDGRFLRP